VAPNLHYDSASASPLSLHSKEIKYTKRATRANARRRDAPTHLQPVPLPQVRPRPPSPPEPPRAIATLVLDGVTVRDILKTAVDLAIDRGAARTS